MGVAITNILKYKEISIEELSGKTFAVDAFNIIYQFLSTIRARDGELLTDSQGRVTSHLIGLFNRFSTLMEKGLKFVFVFDGTPPSLKRAEQESRHAVKEDAMNAYKKAKDEEDFEGMQKYAARTSILTEEMIEDAKRLISAMGIPIIQAPSEGEAQAAYLVKKGECYAVLSQDTDSFLFESPRFVKDLTISQKRKKGSTLVYEKVVPKIYELAENLNLLRINHEQFIALSILVGTDYNPKGIKGIGPKKALKLVQIYNLDFDRLFDSVEWYKNCEVSWREIYKTIKDIPVKKDYTIKHNKIDEDKIINLLVKEHDFNKERVENVLRKLKKQGSIAQRGLGEFIR